MAPKAKKKGSEGNKKGSAKKAGNGNWEAELINAQFEEDSWQACVTVVVGKSPVEEELLQSLSSASSHRKFFTSLTWDDTVTKIREIWGSKTKKTEETPMFYEAAEAVKMLMDAGQEIPCDLMAKLVKSQLLEIKANDQLRREDERIEKGNPAHSSDKVGATSAEKKRKSAASPVGPLKEQISNLKGPTLVESLPPTFIEDAPDDGPHHYILLIGFYQPHLIVLLDSIGVHVANIVELNSQQHIQSVDGSGEQDGFQNSETNPKASVLREALESDSKLRDVAQLGFTVSDHLLPFNDKDPEAVSELGSHILEGVVNLIYNSLKWRRQYRHYQNNLQLLNIPTVEWDLLPAEKPAVDQDPTDQETNVLKASLDVDNNMCYYNSLLDLVPPETCSVPMILHCMLEQVVVSTESPVVEEPKPSSGPWLDPQMVGYMIQSFQPLIPTEEERSRLINELLTTVEAEQDKKSLMEKFGANGQRTTAKEPLVIRHHNERALRLRDVNAVQGFDPAEVEVSMMRLTPVWELIQSVAQQPNSSSSWMSVVQQLRHYCADDVVPWSEVERSLHQSVFEAMPLTSLNEQSLNPPGPPPPVLPWDNPLLYAQQQLSHMQTKEGITSLTGDDNQFSVGANPPLDLSDLQQSRWQSLFDRFYTEHHDTAVFPQVLQAASEEYHCMDTFRGSHNDTLYIFCHNPMTRHRQSREAWKAALHTDVGFRTYLERVAQTISDWTREEEEKRIATQPKTQILSCVPIREEIDVQAEEERDDLEPIIRKESLKAWKLEQEQLKQEEMGRKLKKDTLSKAKQSKQDKSTPNKKNKSRPQTAVTPAKTPTPPPADMKEEPKLETESLDVKTFTGFNTGGKLLHVSGLVQRLYPSDGGQITVETTDFVEGSSLLKIALKKDGHHFFTHINQVVVPVKAAAATQDETPADLDVADEEREKVMTVKQGSLSALLNTGIHLSYSSYGPTGECDVKSKETKEEMSKISPDDPVPLPSATNQSELTNLQTQSCKDTPPHLQGCRSQTALASFNSLNVSVPNGLLLQFLQDSQGVPTEEKGVVIRQSFPVHATREGQRHLHDTSLSKERSRVITSKGAVIRHMRDGATEVLFADGAVSFSQDSGPVWVPDNELREAKDSEGQSVETEAEEERGFWCTTAPSGHRISTVGNTHRLIPTSSLLTTKATDPITQQVMLSREDLVVSVQNPDGSVTVEHADGTRITRFLKGEQPEVATPHPAATSVTQFINSGNENMHVLADTTGGTSERLDIGDEMGCSEMSELNTQETVTENREGSTQESQEKTASNKEQVVLVEKEGCATVVMYPQQHEAHVFLADGTVITGNSHGDYEVFPSSVGLLQIQRDGKCVYTSDLFVTTSPTVDYPSNAAGTYTMSHTDKVACDVTDLEGNCFQVMEDGQVSVVNSSSAPRTVQLNEEEEREVAIDRNNPRLYMVHKDGSGTELLDSHVVEELLYQAYSDPMIALLKEPLTESQETFGITILKPSHQNVWSQWLVDKQSPDITPSNLRNRSWHDFPRVEKKIQGPALGTDVGSGQFRGSTARRQPLCSCPKVLEIRELYQHRPVTTPLKDIIDSRLRDFIQILMKKELQSEEMKLKDPRTEESADASNLLNLILSFTEEEDTTPSVHKSNSVDMASLYSQGVGALSEDLDVSDDAATIATDSLETFKCSSDRNYSKWNERLEDFRWDLREEKHLKEALRKKVVVPFFDPENVLLYQDMQQSRKADMRSLSVDLQPIKSESEQLFLKDVPQESTPRPLNPTPSQTMSRTASSGRTAEERPTNPTPQSRTEKRSLRASGRTCRSLQLDVTGQPRKTKVRLPTSILGSKPKNEPNQQFLDVEEPVRRRCRTISLIAPSAIIRGFLLLPSTVDFGPVQEGTSSSVTVIMRNVGVDTCRFHVKQPSSLTGIRVIYNPGPVAAGLHVKLQVQLFAMRAVLTGEAEPQKFIREDVIIHTETEILHLPVTAMIIPLKLYDNWLEDRSSSPKKKESRMSNPLKNTATRKLDSSVCSDSKRRT